jgi:hypothetical protein
MAPVLQCPDCKTKHPLDAVGDRVAFPCDGCGRTLKMPEMARATTHSDAPAPAPPPREATQVVPVAAPADPEPAPAAPPAAAPAATARAKVSWWMRLLLWIFAVPVSFLVVFFVARASGLFTHEQLTDVFLANGRSRFWPLARLLPIVALMIALIVQGGVILLSRRRVHAHGSTTRGNADASTPSTRTNRT